MHWLSSTLLLLLAALVQLAAAQDGKVPITTIVDLLSASPQYSTLLEHLQRHGLIPLINQSRNATLLAPVNSAFARFGAAGVDRDTLLYHLLNGTVTVSDDERPTEWLVPSYLHAAAAPGAGGEDPAGPGINVYINGDSVNHDDAVIVEADVRASPERGIVQAISDVLTVPRGLCDALLNTESTTTFAELLNLGATCSGLRGRQVTAFAPVNSAFAQFNSVELRYLYSGYAASDRDGLVRRHLAPGVLDPQNVARRVRLLDGSTIKLGKDLTVNGTFEPRRSWVVTGNGLLNIYADTLGHDIIDFTPEKYLHGLDGHAFVRELQLYGLSELIDGSHTEEQTVLLPLILDDSTVSESASSYTIPAGPETEADQLALFNRAGPAEPILYQFLSTGLQVNTSKMETRTVDTRLPLLSGKYQQRAQLMVRPGGTPMLNWQRIVDGPYVLGNTTIYVTDGKVPVPPSLALAVGPLFLSSYSLEFLDELGLLKLSTEDSWTLLLPTRQAWEEEYLLKLYFDDHPHELRKVFDNLIWRQPIYSDSAPANVTLLDGSEGEVAVVENHRSPSRLSFKINGIKLHAQILDILFDNGVAHVVDDIFIPPSLEISAQDLIESGGRGEFLELLRVNDLGHVLDPKSNYTIFVPSPDALKRANYTADSPKVKEMLALHLLEGNPIVDLFNGENAPSMGDEEVWTRRVSDNTWAVGLVGSRGQRAFISSYADTRGYTSSGSSVLFIDTFLDPDWVHSPYIKPPFRLRTHTLVLLGMIIGLMVMCVAVLLGVVFIKDDGARPSESAGEGSSGSGRYRDDPEAGLNIQNADVGDESDEDAEPTPAIRTTHRNDDRAYGRHLDLP